MSYTILETHAIYHENKLHELAVLWVSNPYSELVRASYCTTVPCSGYKFLMPNDVLSPSLIQSVAGSGMNLPDAGKRKFFPGKRKWER